MTIDEKVKQYFTEHKMADIGDGILVGLSGGADSVCLLFILLALSKELRLRISAVHVNHCIRGEEAERDEMFCKDLCLRLNVPLTVVKCNVPAISKTTGMSLEEAGRKARYESFEELAGKLDCNRIAVAHHMNDLAETFLFQLLRGSRLAGLSGIHPVNGRIIRPLLCLTREEIEQYLDSVEESYVVDSTNLQDDYSRNIIRNRMLKDAEIIQTKSVQHIADTAAYLDRVRQFVDEQADELYSRCAEEKLPDMISLEVNNLLKADRLLAESVVYSALCKVAGRKKDITSEFVEDCLLLAGKQTGKSINLKYGLTARRVYDSLVIRKAPFDNSNANCNNELVIEKTDVPDEAQAVAFVMQNGGFPDGRNKKLFDENKLIDTFGKDYKIELRKCLPEDEIQVYSDGRKKRCYYVLADEKVSEDERPFTEVAAIGNEVLLIPGIRGSEAFRISEETKKIIGLSIQEV